MRIILASLCKCCIIEEDPKEPKELKESSETVVKESKMQESQLTEQNFTSPFRLKETRQRSIDYVINSPRFGGNFNIPVCSTGGTENITVSEGN
ncbi:hypothetical protein SteCoe_2859 [Stentor coeruleus]|uniref:Uncharacterized protein n=1 Tax=Stentor coeruleus TaxID=5963 RepID=A0A1R2CYM0_9CILI|nr:hypothetical protein SteCoe_2859 [Stentor coeruleus]